MRTLSARERLSRRSLLHLRARTAVFLGTAAIAAGTGLSVPPSALASGHMSVNATNYCGTFNGFVSWKSSPFDPFASASIHILGTLVNKCHGGFETLWLSWTNLWVHHAAEDGITLTREPIYGHHYFLGNPSDIGVRLCGLTARRHWVCSRKYEI
jgi:hypothetical protein